jgi:N-acetylmuramoyl-L-alanine amidase
MMKMLAPAIVLLACTLAGGPARAQSGPPSLTGVRSFTGPTSTRIFFEFSKAVAHVAPDSGIGHRVRITVPGEAVARAAGVPERIAPNDGVVDSVLATTGVDGARFEIWLRDSTKFRVFGRPAQTDKPYTIVLDVTRVGGEAAQNTKLQSVASAKKDRLRLVAVDAGHGGEDTGARGAKGVLEKNVTLAVARGVVAELNKIPGVRGVLVRDGDYFIPLRTRYANAEKMKADLFVSIHCNSSKRKGRGSGTEVYFLSLRGAADQASQDLADVENAADRVGGVPSQADDELVNILYDVKRTGALQQSQLLAESILDKVATDERLESRGIKQAGFVVLKSVEFPSVLVETAFINNPREAKLLASPDFQRQISRQIATGVKTYFERAGIELTEPGREGS